MTETSENQWFAHYKPQYIEDINIYPNATLYNRRIYTFGKDKEIYMKLSSMDETIGTYDELAFIENSACYFKIGHNRFIEVIERDDKVAVIGELSQRCIEKNGYNNLVHPEIKKAEDFNLVPLSSVYDSSEFNHNLIMSTPFSDEAFKFNYECIKTGSA